MIDLSRYLLEPLRKDEEFILYRARSSETGSQVAFASRLRQPAPRPDSSEMPSGGRRHDDLSDEALTGSGHGAPTDLGQDAVSGFGPNPAVDGRSQVLVLSPALQRPPPSSLGRLQHEYALRKELDPSWAAQPIGMAREWDRPVLLLTDPGGLLLSQLLGPAGNASASADAGGQPLDVAFCLRVAVGLSTAIGQLHQHSVIHKDLKPPNVLVNPVTGQCWLTGFGIASRLPRERPSPEPPEVIAGTLAYMPPEQTGRMNRSIDSRSDLYSLGVTLYEMLTGSLPFMASDPMEWVHCHIARQPAPPRERRKDVPETVSAIILKLLSKTAEDRYQTAAGLLADLRRCLAAWESRGGISSFSLGAHDISDRILMPEKLYGRDREIKTLLDAFDEIVATGKPGLVLVSGYSGIGKSSVVSELHKVLVPPHGLFASGKFDQYKPDVPYATLAQAFKSLIHRLLNKSEAELEIWRDAFREALEPNAKLMVDLVPELNLIIGEQPPVPDLPAQDAQRRFQLVFRRFIGVFARPEHPLALFLDDLQWLDAATLDFLEDLLTQPDVHHLMLIGAYRDNEIDSTHPLWRRLAAIRATGAILHEIVLAPLGRADLGRLIVDSLHCEPDRALPLTQLVHEKTGGNPFFVIQFIHTLVEEQLLTFDHNGARWFWDLNRIRAKGYTDNVVELMVGKLNRLPVGTQKALQELACLGNSAEIATISVVHGTSQKRIHSDLWPAVRLELVARHQGVYKFIHDRIQEAAYSLIPEHSRAETHLKIGRLLRTHVPPEKTEEAVFDIVNQLNRGLYLITSIEERERLAELNLIAGRRAKMSTAYVSALSYLTAARAMLSEQTWIDRYELIFSIECLIAECELLSADMDTAEKRLSMLVERARSEHDIAVVTRLRLTLYTTLDRSDRAVEVCLEYLRRGGTDWSPHPPREEVRREYDRIWARIRNRQIEELIDLPLMTNPDVLDALDVLSEAVTPALFCDENLSSLVICRIVNLSLEHGNSDASCFAYVWFAIIAGPRFGNYKDGFRFGRLGYDLVEKRGLKRFQARTYMSFGDIVLPWTRHVREGRDLVRRAFDAAKEIGDVTFGGYCCDHLVKNMLAAGDPLVEVQSEAENGLRFAQNVRFGLVVDHLKAQLGLVRTLRGLTPRFGSFNDDEFDELRFESYLGSNPALAELECWYWVRKLQARFFAGDYLSAIEASSHAQRQLWTSPSQFESAELCFFGALARAALICPATSALALAETEALAKEEHFKALAEQHERLTIWAKNCPENFENRAALVGAEIARIEHRELEAERLYEQAIRSSRANGFIHNEALANELAARFYAARGFDTIADTYLRRARDCYIHWGATGKVQQLDQLYLQLREEKTIPTPTGMIGTPVEHLDLATVIKVSQAVSGEVVLEKLIDTIMRTALEQAGAERGILILQRGVEQRIEAEAVTIGDTITVRSREPSLAEAAVPESVVRYVVRTRESVLLDDAFAPNPFSADPFISRRGARSILCLPLINQGKLTGVLYLENSLTPNVFTPARITVLKVLASQAAISLENTHLYRELGDRETKLRLLVDANIMGIYIWNHQEIRDANEALLRIVGYSREDLVSGGLRWAALTPPDWRERDNQAHAELEATGTIQPFEKEYLRKDGSRVPVLLGCATFAGNVNEGVAFVLDLSKQKGAEDALHRAQVELARVSRITTMEQLAASIAHEVNQPLAAVVASSNACRNWLSAAPPNLGKARDAVERIVRDANRASDVLKRVRALLKKAPLAKAPLNINDVVREVLALVDGELRRRGVEVSTELDLDLPIVLADFVQLQQVILNLVMNAIESMTAITDRPRVLQIRSRRHDLSGQSAVLVAVCDSGTGLGADAMVRVFEAFYSTKPQGMGMGLWICRSIIEAHGGQLTAQPNDDFGATFQFVLPASAEQSA